MKEQKKNFDKKENAITLIALIISIIVLLILAGVSMLAIIGDNGILKEAERAAEESYIASEKEAIEQLIALENIDKIQNPDETSKYYVGQKLGNIKYENGNSVYMFLSCDSRNLWRAGGHT